MGIPNIWRKKGAYYALEGTVCRECGAKWFPPREVCAECSSLDMERHSFRGKGSIVTYTVVRTKMQDPEGVHLDIPSRSVPYVVAIVELEDGPCLTAQIVDCSPEDVRIGMNVEMVFRRIVERGKGGLVHYGYKFRPAKQKG